MDLFRRRPYEREVELALQEVDVGHDDADLVAKRVGTPVGAKRVAETVILHVVARDRGDMDESADLEVDEVDEESEVRDFRDDGVELLASPLVEGLLEVAVLLDFQKRPFGVVGALFALRALHGHLPQVSLRRLRLARLRVEDGGELSVED